MSCFLTHGIDVGQSRMFSPPGCGATASSELVLSITPHKYIQGAPIINSPLEKNLYFSNGTTNLSHALILYM